MVTYHVEFPVDGNGDQRTIEYHVDAQGRRIGRRIKDDLSGNPNPQFSEQRFWLYEDLSSIHPTAELDGATGALRARFVYGERSHVPSLMVLYTTNPAEVYRFITDTRGSVRQVVKVSDGSVAQQIEYGPFGEVLADSSPGFQHFGYAGGLYDHETGLVRFGVRDYDPVVGRWLAEDPIGFEGSFANLYSYVNQNPINSIDPTGKVNWDISRYQGETIEPPVNVGSALIAVATALICHSIEDDDTLDEDNPLADEYDDVRLTEKNLNKILKEALILANKYKLNICAALDLMKLMGWDIRRIRAAEIAVGCTD